MIQQNSVVPMVEEKPVEVKKQPIVQIRNLTRKFGSAHALDNVTMEIPRGVVMGLVGLNGAGKTTLLKHILGMYRAQEGSVSVFGCDPSRDPVKVLSRVGYLTEEDSLPGWMTAEQLLSFSRSFYPDWDSEYERELLDTFDLDPSRRIDRMSKGQKARVGLTVALAHRPEFLVLDEPGSGLDPVVRNDILNAIIRTIADSGKTVLFSSHLLDEVQRVSDEVALIRGGKLVECGPLDSLQTRYQRVTLKLDNDNGSDAPDLDALGKWNRSGSEWSAIVDLEDDSLEKAVASIGAKIVRTHGVSLNEWFINSAR